MILQAIGWAFLAAVIGTAVSLGVRVYLAKRMAEAFELGVKMGRGLALMPKFQVEEWLREAGVDASMLPGFAYLDDSSL